MFFTHKSLFSSNRLIYKTIGENGENSDLIQKEFNQEVEQAQIREKKLREIVSAYDQFGKITNEMRKQMAELGFAYDVNAKTNLKDILDIVRFLDTEKREIAEQKNIELEQLTIVDGLTGLYNRRYFDQRIAEAVSEAQRKNRPLSIFMLDLDKFKQTNDIYGHLGGDETLKQVAEILKSFCRSEDVVCRYGGEEFVVILPETTTEQALDIAERIRKKIEEKDISHNGKIIKTRTSIGISTKQGEGFSPQEITEEADKLLYKAKNQEESEEDPNTRNRIALKGPNGKITFFRGGKQLHNGEWIEPEIPQELIEAVTQPFPDIAEIKKAV